MQGMQGVDVGGVVGMVWGLGAGSAVAFFALTHALNHSHDLTNSASLFFSRCLQPPPPTHPPLPSFPPLHPASLATQHMYVYACFV